MPPEYLQILKTKQELENAQNELENSRKIFNETSISYRNNILQVFEKIAFYSVGSISLSITYVGYVLSQKTGVLSEIVFYMSLYVYLFISWGFLVVSLLTTLFVRWTDITYVFWARQKEYYQAKKKEHEKMIPFLETYPTLVFPSGKNKETEKAIYQTNIATLDTVLIPTTVGYEKRSFLLDRIIRYIAIGSFVLGILVLLFFVTWTVYLQVI